MKDFIISSPLLYGHVPGGAISDHKPFCQAFCSSLSHFSALEKWGSLFGRRLLKHWTLRRSWSNHAAVTICCDEAKSSALSKLVIYMFLCQWVSNYGSYTFRIFPRAFSIGQWIIQQTGRNRSPHLTPFHEPAINFPPMPYGGNSCVGFSMPCYLFISQLLLLY